MANEYDDIASSMAKDPQFAPQAPTDGLTSIGSQAQVSTPNPDLASAPAANPFMAAAAEMKDGARNQLKASVFTATGADPERAAKVRALADQRKLPIPIVERNFDELSRDQKQADIDPDKLIDSNPKLAAWLANPDNANLAVDDVSNLKKIEDHVNDYSFMKDLGSWIGEGASKFDAAVYRLPGFAMNAADLPFNLAFKAMGHPEWQLQAPDYIMNNKLATEADSAAQRFHSETLDKSVIDQTKNGDYGSAARSLIGKVITGAPTLAAMMGATYIGGPSAGLAVAGGTAGSEANQDAIKEGADPANAATNAVIKGTTQLFLERIGTLSIVKDWEHQLSKEVGKEAGREVMKSVGKTLAYSAMKQGNEQVWNSFANDFADQVTGVNPHAGDGIYERALEQGIVGAATGVGVTSPGAALYAHANHTAAQNASISRDFYSNLGDAVENSKLHQRSPEAKADLIKSVTDGSPVQDVHIPVEAMNEYFQSKNINPVKFASDLGVEKAYDEAMQTGGDVKIPLAKYVEKVGGTEHWAGLKDDVKFSPQDVTAREAANALNETTTQMQKESDAASEAPDDQQKKLSADEVGQHIKQSLLDTGKFDESTAKTQSLLHQEFFRTMGERTGIDPRELYDKSGLTIRSLDGAEPTSEQSAAQGERTLNQSESRYGKFQVRNDMPETVKVVHAAEPEVKEIRKYSNVERAALKAENDAKGKSVVNDMTGQEIKVSSNSIMKATSGAHDSLATRVALSNLHDLMKNAVLEGSEPITAHEGNQAQNKNIDHFDRYYAPLKFGDKEALVRFKIGVEKSGDAFYHHVAVENERPAGTNAAPDESGTSGFSGSNQISIQDFADRLNNSRQNNTWFQGDETSPRGRIRFNDQRRFSIDLFKSSDLSTFLHESGHFYMEIVKDLATSENAPEQLKGDYQTIREWLGAKDGEDITTDQHEQWARGFERYLMEGKAPSNKLREAFARFKVWLTGVYRSVANLNVELTPEIKDVMGRLLATDDEIKTAYQKTDAKPMITEESSKLLGLNDEQKQRYADAMRDTHIATEEHVSSLVMKDFDRQRQAWFKEESKKTAGEVQAEFEQRPEYKALDALKNGLDNGTGTKQDIKIDRKLFLEQRGREALNAMPKGIFSKDGFDPRYTAELLGFRSTDEMIGTLADLKPMKAAVAEETQNRMNQKHPDILVDGKLPEEAVAAVHNEKRSDLLRMELKYLAENHNAAFKDVVRAIAKRVPPDAETKAQARDIVGSRTTADLKPYLFQRAETKAANEAAEKLSKGDIAGAFDAKKRELLNHELYRATVEANDAMEKSQALFKKFERGDEDLAKSRDLNLVNAGRAILAQFGIGKSDRPFSKALDQMKAYDPEAFESMKAIIESATANPKPVAEMSFDDHQALSDTVKAIWDLSRSSRQMEIDGQIRDRADVKAELIAQLNDRSAGNTPLGEKKAITDLDKAKLKFLGAAASLRRVESWARNIDGGEAGAFTKNFVRPVIDATTTYRHAQADQLEAFKNLLEPIRASLKDTEIRSPELDYTFKGRAELLAALLHTGNKSNLEKLLLGRNWGEISGEELNTSRWDRFIDRMKKEGKLTKADYDFVQGVWDLNEKSKPEAQKAHKKMYGFYFNEVTADSFTNEFGDYRGGYMPAVTDPLMVEDAAIRGDKESLEQGGNSYMFPTAGRGFTKSRVDQYHAPLMLDLRMVPSHLDKVMRFVHLEPIVRDIAKIVNSKDFRSSLSGYDPVAAQDMLTPWLQRAVTQRVETPSQGQGGKFLDSAAKFIKARGSMQMMVLNVSSALLHMPDGILAGLRIPMGKVASGFFEYMKAPHELTNTVLEKSPYMEAKLSERTRNLQSEISDIILNPSKFDTVKAASIKHGYVFSSMMAHFQEISVWQGAYEHAIEKGMAEKEAVHFSDAVVRETQFASEPENISRAETGSPFQRMFTMLYSYFNGRVNLLSTEASLAAELGMKKGMSRGAYVYAFGLLVPSIFSAMIKKTLAGQSLLGDDHDEGYVGAALEYMFGAPLEEATALVPGGQFATTFINSWNDKPYDDRLSNPATAMAERLATGPSNIVKALEGKAPASKGVSDALTLLGMMTKSPLGAAGRPLGYLADVAQGRAQPTGPIDFARGLATGKSPQK